MDEFGADRFDYREMINFMHSKCLAEMNEWEERFVNSIKAKLSHPDAHAVSKKEVAEFLTKNERIKIVQVWNNLGL